ncbi:MAG: hypothetical protein ABFS43_05210 [Thermodesulfobacteriota bacterium]
MKSILTLCLLLLIASCASVPLEHGPDMWQYDDDKFVSFKRQVIMSWEYDDPTIGCFEVDREIKQLSKADIQKITKLVKDENEKELIKIVNTFKDETDFKDDAISYPAKDEREFIDQEKPLPEFGDICFYRLYAVENCDPQITPIRSDPAELSVIILPK